MYFSPLHVDNDPARFYFQMKNEVAAIDALRRPQLRLKEALKIIRVV